MTTAIQTTARDFERAMFATFKTAAAVGRNGALRSGPDCAETAAKLFGSNSRAASILTRGATAPLTTDDLAGETGLSPLAAFFASVPQSAGARLLSAGTVISLRGYASVALPYPTTPPAALNWIAEGAPIPVHDYSLAKATIGPVRKAAIITVHSREVAKQDGAEAIFTALLRRDAARTLDAALFHANAETDAAPAGLLHGVTPLTAEAGGGAAAMEADLASLAVAVTGNGGQSVAYVAAPGLALLAQLRLPELADKIWSSSALTTGTVIAIDPAAFVAAFDPDPAIEGTTDATLHMEDEAPAPIGTPGTPTVTAAPARNLFQTDTVALRLIYEGDFGMAASGLVQAITGANWA